jgi:hypothetical protein
MPDSRSRILLQQRLCGLADADLILERDAETLLGCLEAASRCADDGSTARERRERFIALLERLLQESDLGPEHATPVLAAAAAALRELAVSEQEAADHVP